MLSYEEKFIFIILIEICSYASNIKWVNIGSVMAGRRKGDHKRQAITCTNDVQGP